MKQGHSQFWIEVKNYLFILIGSAIVAIGFNTLLLPNQIAAGGVSGISTIMQSFGFEAAYVQWGLNIPLFIAGFYLLGGTFGVKTLVGSIFYLSWCLSQDILHLSHMKHCWRLYLAVWSLGSE